MSGFTDFLNDELDLRIRTTDFCGDLHLSEEEKTGPSQVGELVGREVPYWLIVAGGKYDYTIKWWRLPALPGGGG